MYLSSSSSREEFTVRKLTSRTAPDEYFNTRRKALFASPFDECLAAWSWYCLIPKRKFVQLEYVFKSIELITAAVNLSWHQHLNRNKGWSAKNRNYIMGFEHAASRDTTLNQFKPNLSTNSVLQKNKMLLVRSKPSKSSSSFRTVPRQKSLTK
jgi:hypothetical protein